MSNDNSEDVDVEEQEEVLPKEVLKRVLGLRKLCAEIEEIDVEYKAERVQLELKYLAKKAPIYEKRKLIVGGAIEPEFPPAESGAEEQPAPDSIAAEGEEVKGVPSFWLQAMANHPVIGDIMQQEDTSALESLEDIKIQYDETFNTFTLFFEFKPNEYFNNTVLTKKYSLTDIFDEKGPQLLEVVGTEIEWKEGKNLCMKEIKKKQKAKSGKNKGQVRQITKLVPKPSFFHFFSEPKNDEDDEDEEDGKEDEEQERITLNEEEDYEVAHAFRTSIIPDAVLWYTGEARDDEDYDEDEEGDEDEEDEDAEEEEEDDEPKKKDGKSNKGKAAGFAAPSSGSAGKDQPECKQN